VTVGALESNAGDDFHFWWAATRVLALLEPGGDLTLVAVEGLTRVDDPDEEYQAVDVAEYFGGDTIDDATGVVVSQLKHSTRHPDTPWTVSRLCRRQNKRRVDGTTISARSVIGDLAGVYKALIETHSYEQLVGKVRIALVSNQPGDPLLLESIDAAAAWARSRRTGEGKAAMLSALSEAHEAVVRPLADAVASRLGSHEFCDFITVLDLSQTGTLGRAALARSVTTGASDFLPGRGGESARRLFELVRSEALPERTRDGIRAVDVLATLGVADPADLYPAPARLTQIDDPLPAPGSEAIAAEALANAAAIVVAHGSAGAGKTTALRQIGDHLPPGSVVLMFDCYGGGDYLNAGEERHTSQRFVMQMLNELAIRCGTSLLLQPPAMEEDLWRWFGRNLEAAVRTLDPEAVLVLGVDAADNAAIAAAERGDRGFLKDLVRLRLPARCTVVLSARSHRVDTLGVPGAASVEVTPFDHATSGAHLRRYRPDESDVNVTEFHNRTDGNPRAQYYALTQGEAQGWDMPTLLEACDRTPEPLFKDLIDSALQVSGENTGGRSWLACMLALARPVRIETFATLLGVDSDAVVAFAHGLTPGVALVDGKIRFRDEDFETYVRGRVDPSDLVAAHGGLADLFLSTYRDDADATAHVADHLFAAGRLDAVLQLVLEEDWPQAIPDGFRRAQVQGRRLDLAARAAAETDDAAAAVRLAVRGCDTASRLDTLSSLVDSHFDLVVRYSDIDLLRTHALHQSHNAWLAPIHMRLAAALSRDPAHRLTTHSELEHADAWLHRWMADPEEETIGWDIDVDDVACAAEARYRLDGFSAAAAELRRWRPANFAMAAAAELASRVAAEAGPGSVREALIAEEVPHPLQAPFLAYSGAAADPERGWVDEVVAALLAADRAPAEPWNGLLIEVAARHGDRTMAASLARHWMRPLPSHLWGFSTGAGDGVAALRVHSLAAVLGENTLTVDDLLPPSLRPRNEDDTDARDLTTRRDDTRDYERRQWTEAIGPLLEAALLAARAVVSAVHGNEVTEFVVTALANRLEKAGHRWFTIDNSYRAWAVMTADAAVDSGAVDVIDQLADAAPTLLRDGAPELWLDLAACLVRRGTDPNRAADLCVRAAAQAREDTYSAPDRLDLLARAAELAGDVAPTLGKHLFDEAVDAATGINDDAARLMALYADLAERAAIAEADRAKVAVGLVRATEAVSPYVTDTRVVPYSAVARAVGRIDAYVGLAAVSRWDDEDRVDLGTTAPSVVLGAVDGGALSAAEALSLGHLVEQNGARLRYLTASIDRLPRGASGTASARVAVRRVTEWLRSDVPARDQPRLAHKLLDWATEHGLDDQVRPILEPVVLLDHDETHGSGQWHAAEAPSDIQELIDHPDRRSWLDLAEDFPRLLAAGIYGDPLREFCTSVVLATQPDDRVAALAAVADLPGHIGTDVVVDVLARCLTQWNPWPEVAAWGAAALPSLLERRLTDLAWRQETDALTDQLRAFASDDGVRRAVLAAIPAARSRLTPFGWQNIAAVLGRLCSPMEAANALTTLLTERFGEIDVEGSDGAVNPLPLFLWCVSGHPRRSVRWRASHCIRDLLTFSDQQVARDLAAALVECLDRTDPGSFRDPALHFYRLSAATALLTALARVACDLPDLLHPHVDAITRHALSRDLPHAQIREIARSTALAVTTAHGPVPDQLLLTNQPPSCFRDRGAEHRHDDCHVSDSLRYDFDSMDTIPYWFAPLARVFDLPVDAVAERAERWIIDEWGLGRDDWMTDRRELRDQRSWQRMSHRHGSIPPEENLRLYLEYHAMMCAAGELVDAGFPVRVSAYDDAEDDPWRYWLEPHLPNAPGLWLADLRSAVPAEPQLFGMLPPIDVWVSPDSAEFDRVMGLIDGRLPDPVLVAGHGWLHRRGAYSHAYIWSALVGPEHAADLQRALAAATNPTDWKLPDEGEDEFEVDHAPFTLFGWLANPRDSRDCLDEHDPYAAEIRPVLPMPGDRFRRTTGAAPDRTGLILRQSDGRVVARAEQWGESGGDEVTVVTSSGVRTRVDHAILLSYLGATGTALIVEVQIGRHRSDDHGGEYQPPRSRIYVLYADGRVTVC